MKIHPAVFWVSARKRFFTKNQKHLYWQINNLGKEGCLYLVLAYLLRCCFSVYFLWLCRLCPLTGLSFGCCCCCCCCWCLLTLAGVFHILVCIRVVAFVRCVVPILFTHIAVWAIGGQVLSLASAAGVVLVAFPGLVVFDLALGASYFIFVPWDGGCSFANDCSRHSWVDP